MFEEFENTITPEELQEKLARGEKVNIVDVREDDEVAAGMIPGAIHIMLAEVPISLDKFKKDEEYILVCRSGSRSQMGCEFLDERGYKVVNMVGGMSKWTGELKK